MTTMDFITLSTTFVCCCFACLSGHVRAYFGISSQQPLTKCLVGIVSAETFSIINNNVSKREFCNSFNKQSRQKRMCYNENGFASVLVEAIYLSASECQKQFEYERWNCSLDSKRINILRHGFKETAYLYAVSASSLVHAISRACSSGFLTQCTCDESFNDKENRKTWIWGGCGDNLSFGQKFTSRFLKQKKLPHYDLRATMDYHNSHVGIKVVRDLTQKVCKCHGTSGSCTIKICWKQLSGMASVGSQLKLKYDNAVEAKINNVAHAQETSIEKSDSKKGKTKRDNSRKKKSSNRDLGPNLGVKAKELVYIDKSPNFCNAGKYSWGTEGRECLRGDNCQEMCCGRGYNVLEKHVTVPCECRVQWCCQVQCNTCHSQKELLTCK